jgi:hypothetical protein
MTITFRDGTSVHAILLCRDEDSLRAVVPGEEDTLIFRFVNGTWISECSEPVTIEVECQRNTYDSAVTEADCICSKPVAAELMKGLYSPEYDELQDQLLRLFTSEDVGLGTSRRHFSVN